MPTQKFSFKKGEPVRLEVLWKWLWKDVSILLDGQEIGRFANRKMLKEGREFYLQDGSVLKIKLSSSWFAPLLEVLHNGKPLPGSGSDPNIKLALAYSYIFFIGGVTIIHGLIVVSSKTPQGGFGMIIIGGIYIFLGFLVKRQSMIALAIAFVVYLLNFLLELASGQVGGNLWLTIAAFVCMYEGFRAIQDLKRSA